MMIIYVAFSPKDSRTGIMNTDDNQTKITMMTMKLMIMMISMLMMIPTCGDIVTKLGHSKGSIECTRVGRD